MTTPNLFPSAKSCDASLRYEKFGGFTNDRLDADELKFCKDKSKEEWREAEAQRSSCRLKEMRRASGLGPREFGPIKKLSQAQLDTIYNQCADARVRVPASAQAVIDKYNAASRASSRVSSPVTSPRVLSPTSSFTTRRLPSPYSGVPAGVPSQFNPYESADWSSPSNASHFCGARRPSRRYESSLTGSYKSATDGLMKQVSAIPSSALYRGAPSRPRAASVSPVRRHTGAVYRGAPVSPIGPRSSLYRGVGPRATSVSPIRPSYRGATLSPRRPTSALYRGAPVSPTRRPVSPIGPRSSLYRGATASPRRPSYRGAPVSPTRRPTSALYRGAPVSPIRPSYRGATLSPARPSRQVMKTPTRPRASSLSPRGGRTYYRGVSPSKTLRPSSPSRVSRGFAHTKPIGPSVGPTRRSYRGGSAATSPAQQSLDRLREKYNSAFTQGASSRF